MGRVRFLRLFVAGIGRMKIVQAIRIHRGRLVQTFQPLVVADRFTSEIFVRTDEAGLHERRAFAYTFRTRRACDVDRGVKPDVPMCCVSQRLEQWRFAYRRPLSERQIGSEDKRGGRARERERGKTENHTHTHKHTARSFRKKSLSSLRNPHCRVNGTRRENVSKDNISFYGFTTAVRAYPLCYISRYRVHTRGYWYYHVCVCAQAASIRDITDGPRVSAREIPRFRLSLLTMRTHVILDSGGARLDYRPDGGVSSGNRGFFIVPATVKINDFSSTIRYQKSHRTA